MRRGFWRILGLACVLCFSAPSFGEDPLSPESLPVRSVQIEIVGDTSGTTGESFLQTLKTKEREKFSQTEFDKDLKLIAKEYDRVEPSVVITDGEVLVSLKVWKKPIIHGIIWKGNQAIEKDTLQKELGVAINSIYDRQGFNKAIQKIRQYYVKKGFFESEIEYKILPVQENESSINVEISVKEGKAGYIEELRFHNFTDPEVDELTEVLMTKEYSFWLSWLTNQGTYFKDVFRQDEHTILTFLQNKGYLDAKVTSDVIPSPSKNNRIIIDITAERGELYHLGKINVSGNTLFSEETLVTKTGLQSGKIYSPLEISKAISALSSLYGTKGYIDASIIPETKLHENERIYDVSFKIEEGKCFRVGMIQIVGNTKTDTSLILHETLLVPGSIFDSTLLAKTEERLRNIGFFKTVNAYAVKSSKLSTDEVPFRDVHIEVEEVPTTARLSAFAGWNSTEGIGGGAGISESNFRLAGFSTLFSKGFRSLRGAGEYMSLQCTVGTKQLTYNLSWTKPYFLDTNWVLGVDYTKQRNSYSWDDYTIHSQQVTVSGKYPLNALWAFGTQYRIRDSDIQLNGIKHTSRNSQLIKESKIGGTLSAVGVSLLYNSTNHPVIPTKGFRSTMLAEFAGVMGDHHFLNLGYLNSFYFSPFSKGVFKFRGDVQAIKPLFGSKPSHLPMDERLYLGGEQTMRGYRYNAVGPKFHDKNKTPRGGMTSLLMSGEYEHPLWKKLNGFLFCDIGNVWWHEFSGGPLKATAGYGLRFYIMEAAPITIGLGYPINPTCKKDVRRFFFTIGLNF